MTCHMAREQPVKQAWTDSAADAGHGGVRGGIRKRRKRHIAQRNRQILRGQGKGVLLRAAHRRCDHIGRGAHPFVCGAHLRARRFRPTPEYLFVKRAMDIALSLAAIIISSPFMAVTALAIFGYDRGPVLYQQVRLTRDGKPFRILKFRSMRMDAEKDGVARLASEHDNRITPVGRVIRATRIDELPQFFNILKGDMSIVGPRPERPEIAEQYRKELPAFDLRLQVKAGLTGYAQVYGRYNTEPQDKLKMDLMYINHAGIAEDIKLIFATVRTIFQHESTHGVSEGQVTAMGDAVEGKREESA